MVFLVIHYKTGKIRLWEAADLFIHMQKAAPPKLCLGLPDYSVCEEKNGENVTKGEQGYLLHHIMNITTK